MSAGFDYLVRFEDENGETVYGNLSDYQSPESLVGIRLPLLSGSPLTKLEATAEERIVRKVLCPLESTPIFQCIGVNYATHAGEANFPVPSQPVVFTKPLDSIAGPFDEIYCHPDSRSQLDYEGELCFVFGKDGKDVKEEEALDYVFGYTIGNDLTARNFIPMEVSGMQMSYGKSFDAFAPIGPYIASPAKVGNPHNLQLVTKVNKEVRQQESTSDMIWKINQIIPHLTRGRTVRKGTVCMTGTPSGVGWFMKPPGFLHDGDTVEVSIDKLGTLINTISFKD